MFTKKLLKELNSLFFRVTHIPLSLFYSNKGNITYLTSPKCLSNLCKLIQSNENGKKRCFESDSKAIGTAIKTKKPEVYCCHVGIINIALPIVINNENVGAIFAGPLLIHKLSSKDIEKYINKLKDINLDTQVIRRTYQNISDIRICSKKDIKFAIRILSMLAHFLAYKEIARKFSRKKFETASELQKKVKILQNKLNIVMPYLKIETKKDENLTFHQKAVKRAKEYIDNNFDKDISLKDVATVAALSPTYFSFVFKKESKINFEDYLILARIEKAKKLLKETFYSIGEIAFNVGYFDQNYFSFLFRKITGVSPRTYRKNKI